MTVPVGAAGVRGLGGRGYLTYAAGGGAVGRGGSGGASYGQKVDKQAEEKLYDLLPGMELTPMNPTTMSLKMAIKPATQVTAYLRHAPTPNTTAWYVLADTYAGWTLHLSLCVAVYVNL